MIRSLTSAIRWLAACALVASIAQSTFVLRATADKPAPAEQRSQQSPAPAPSRNTGDTPDAQAKPEQQTQPPRQQAQTPRPTPAPPSLVEPTGRPVNVQIEVTIADQTGSGAPEKKTVSMIVADRAFGRIRASGITQVRADAVNPLMMRLNVDARPSLQPNDAIRLEFTLEYEAPPPASSSPDVARRTSPLNESLTVLLQPGKTLTISRAADPVSDRHVTVDVTATILK